MFGLPKKPDRYFPGKIITATDLNLILDRLDKLEKMSGDGQVQIDDGPGGIQFSLSKHITEIRRFYLLENLISGGTARAELLYIDKNNALQHLSTVTFNVKDVLGIFTGMTGDKGYCITLSDSRNYWEIIQMEC